MVSVLRIPETGNYEIVDIPEDSVLSSLQALVGGYIEYLDAPFGENPSLVVNEEGMFHCQPSCCLWANRRMEEMGYLSQLSSSPVKEGELYTILFGPVLAVNHRVVTDEDGCPSSELCDITAEQIEDVLGVLTSNGQEIVRLIQGLKG